MRDTNPLSPTPSVLAALASIAVHAEEYFSPSGHEYDKAALLALLKSTEVRDWLLGMDQLSLLPVKRERPVLPSGSEPWWNDHG